LMWSIDIAGIVSENKNESFFEKLFILTRKINAYVPLYYSLKYVRENNLAAINDDVLDILKNGFNERWFGRKIYHLMSEGSEIGQYFELLMLQTKGNFFGKLKFFFESIFPRPKVMREIYPEKAGNCLFAAYIRRTVSIFVLSSRMLFKLIRCSYYESTE
ncbi:MAG: hypothetical protein D6734_08525, partial [Candidatus Schekmanbacteria bacterium]